MTLIVIHTSSGSITIMYIYIHIYLQEGFKEMMRKMPNLLDAPGSKLTLEQLDFIFMSSVGK